MILYRYKEEMRMDKNKKAILAQRVKERMRMLGMNALQLSEKAVYHRAS